MVTSPGKNIVANTIDKTEDAEEQVIDIIPESEKVHGPLAHRLATLEDKYQLLTYLELELGNISDKGDIIAYEKIDKPQDKDTLSPERNSGMI